MEFLEIDNHFFKVDRNERGVAVQLQAYHFNDAGAQCGGIIPIGQGEWVLLSEDPLDVRPSINCDLCPSHYTVVRGRIFDHNDPAHKGYEPSAIAEIEAESKTVLEYGKITW
jgi:hypothetical protein